MSGQTEADKKNNVQIIAEGAVKQEQNNEIEDKRVTTRFMTKYERARILGTRALQIRFVDICCFVSVCATAPAPYSLATTPVV